MDAIDAYETGDFESAARWFAVITDSYPEHPLAYLLLGRSLIELKDYECALEALFDHLKVVPDSVEALIYIGMTYYECGELERAQERYEQALRLRRESILVRENMAITHISAGNFDNALDQLVALHEERPDDAEITELLIVTLGRLGRWEAAKHYVRKLGSALPAKPDAEM